MKNILLTLAFLYFLTSCGVPDSESGQKDEVPVDDHRIFVTSESLAGDFAKDGPDPLDISYAFEIADAKCMELAKAAGLTRKYMAVISTEDTHGSSRFVFSGSIYKVDIQGEKTLVAALGPDLWLTGAKNLLSDVDTDEKGNSKLNQSPWTGTGADGSIVPGSHCTNWTDSSGTGFTGSTANFGEKWVENIDQPCGDLSPIFCISQ